jgi:hypothetical protein
MNKKQTDVLKSAVRHFAITAAGIYAAGVHDEKAVLIGALAAIVGPAIRGIDKSDPAFGLVADVVIVELDKLAKASKKPAVKKKTK